MYPGTASHKDIPAGKIKTLHFKQAEDGKSIISPALLFPAVNITETATMYLIILAVPGLRREDFSIEIAKSVITIAAKKETIPLKNITYRYEYDYTDWTRAFSLPDDADPLLAHATYKNGELVIYIPRNEMSELPPKCTIYVY
ncbi:MAG: Hsp20/alpha crystallin family protein [Bacteroidota bacterium]|nr:Hsp20/alpha crystallin family protein [Bacteroidota bacterium]